MQNLIDLTEEPTVLYAFPHPAPFVSPSEGDIIAEMRSRLPRLEEAMIRDGSTTCSPYAATLFLALQFLRSVSHLDARDPLSLEVSHSTLSITMLNVCLCDDEVWTPGPNWPHAKNAMLRSILREDEAEKSEPERVDCQFKSEVCVA